MQRLMTLTLGLLVFGCGSGPQETVVAAAVEDEPHAEEPPAELAEPLIEDPRFALRLEADGPFVAGESGTLRVRLEPRGAYEVEARYPYRVAFRPSDGLAVSRDELARGDATEINAEQAAFEVDVTPARPGTFNCAVDVEFAVCSESGCVPLERSLAIELSAS